MSKEILYSFVIDSRGLSLSPTRSEKAWYFIRKGKAKLVTQYPLTIKLTYEVDNTDISKLHMGLDVGQTTGIALVQECKTRNKVIFKGEIAHRKDVSSLMTTRKGYRASRRSEKRYRPARFNNRASSSKKGRLAPSIKTRQDEIIRVIKRLQKYISIDRVVIEDVSFDIRCLTDGYKPYRWGYQMSNRLDENLRKATLQRDNFTCQECGAKETMLEAHHIVPKRLKGEDTITNLITLCISCHKKVTGVEEVYIGKFQSLTGGKQLGLRYASHVMQGKTYLYNELCKIINLATKTDGGTTSNRRLDWNIPKSHSNDSIVITGLKPDTTSVYEYTIQPLRKKRKCKLDKSLDIVQGDRVLYTPRGKSGVKCYVTAILLTGTQKGKYKITSLLGKKRYGPLSVKSLTKISTDKGLRVS